MPSKRRVIRVRDVIFKEDEFYQPLDPDMGVLEEERQLVELIEVSDFIPENSEHTEYYIQEQGYQQEHTNEDNPQPQDTQSLDKQHAHTPQLPLPTPPTTRKANLPERHFQTSLH